MNPYKKLVGNSFIFGIGNLGSKVISLVLVPLYTYYLTTAAYGTVDIVTATVSMLLPIVSVSIFEAVLRFIMDKDNDSDIILSNSVLIAMFGFLIAVLLYPILAYYKVMGEGLPFLYLILLTQMMENILAQYARAIGEIKVFAANGILLTFNTGVFNILFLVYFGLGIQGYFWAMVLSNFISVVFLLITTKAHRHIKFNKFNRTVSEEMLIYSVPLIPNSLMWWLINASSRYFILFSVGVNGNGIFAVASKIPAIINLINQVFTQAWQLSAIEEFKSENKTHFYSTVFGYLSSIMFIGTSAVLVVLKYLFEFLFEASYYDGWKVVPFLVLGAVFSCFSGFIGTNYTAAKQTKGVFKTSVYGGIASLALNIIFIPLYGIIGAGISSTISFLIMFIIRYFDTRKYVKIKINWKLFYMNVLIILIQITVLMIPTSKGLEMVLEVALLTILMFINRSLLTPIIQVFKSLNNK